MRKKLKDAGIKLISYNVDTGEFKFYLSSDVAPSYTIKTDNLGEAIDKMLEIKNKKNN